LKNIVQFWKLQLDELSKEKKTIQRGCFVVIIIVYQIFSQCHFNAQENNVSRRLSFSMTF